MQQFVSIGLPHCWHWKPLIALELWYLWLLLFSGKGVRFLRLWHCRQLVFKELCTSLGFPGSMKPESLPRSPMFLSKSRISWIRNRKRRDWFRDSKYFW